MRKFKDIFSTKRCFSTKLFFLCAGMSKEVKLCAKAETDSKDKTITVGERGRRGGREGEAGIWENKGMSNVISSKPFTFFHTFVHPLYFWLNIPVSHHAAVGSVHGITLLYWLDRCTHAITNTCSFTAPLPKGCLI